MYCYSYKAIIIIDFIHFRIIIVDVLCDYKCKYKNI